MTSHHFPPQATALAASLTLQPELWQRPQVQGITIDGPDSRDLDDGVWIEPTSTGAILSVHIADVSELVSVGSILDKVAIARTTTQYFRIGNAPMLPRALSEDKLSLLEYQDRPTLTVKVTLDTKAQIQKTEIFESWLRSSKRFSYAEAEAALNDPASAFSEMLSLSYRWAELLYQQRLANGAIGGRSTLMGDWLNEEGSLVTGVRTNSHLLIQEFMILANRAVAQWLAQRDIPALYRNHTARAIAPDRKTMYQTMQTLGSAQVIRQRLQSWLNRAEYGPALVGHFALNLPAYCHFTSPIRRLADLVNHRIVKALLKQQDVPYTKVELEQLGQHIAQVTRDQEEETSEYFKAAHQKVYQSQIQTPEALKQLSTKEFTRILKFAVENQELEPIALEIETRLKAEKLVIQDFFLLLLKSGNADLQQQVYLYLKNHVQNAASVMAIAPDQQEDWESIEYVELNETSPFIAWMEVTISGEVLTTVHPAEHQRKQTARHLACVQWIEAYLQNALVQPEQRVQPEPTVVEPMEPEPEKVKPARIKPIHPVLLKQFKDEQNFVGMLNELCQTLGWEPPDYEFTDEEPGFECECRLQALDEPLRGSGFSTKKQRAKNFAARQLLEQLQARAELLWGEWCSGVVIVSSGVN
jgi:ribonuclease R